MVVVAGAGAVAVVAAAGGTVGARAGGNEQGNVESKCMKRHTIKTSEKVY